jgi:hypothetical protein
MDIFDLVAKITLDSSEYENGINDASETTKSFGKRMGSALKTAGKIGAVSIAAVGTAGVAMAKNLWNGTKELAEYGDNIDKMSQKMGISAQAYQEWDAVMQHSGTSIDSMQRGMITLSKAAENGAEEFEALGISQEQLASMSQEELFAATIEGLQNMEAGTERTALAQKLLGGSAKELGALLNTSAEDTQAMKDRVHELGGVMSDEAVKAAAQFKDNMQDLGTAISGVKRSISEDFLPAANDMIDGFTRLIAGEDGAEEQIDKGMSELVDAVTKTLDRISDIGDKIFPKISEAITKILPQLVSLGAKIVVQLAQGIIKSLPSMVSGLVSAATDILNVIATDIAPALPEMAVDLVTSLVDALLDNLDLIVDAAINIVTGLAEGLVKAIPKLVEKIPTIIQKLVDAIVRNVPKIAKAGIQLFVSLVKNTPQIIAGIVKAIPEIITSIITGFLELIPGLTGVFEDALDAVEAVFGVIVDFFSGIWDAITGIFGGADGWFGGIFGDAVDLIKGVFGGIADFFSGIWDAIKGVFAGVASFFEKTFGAAASAVKAAFKDVADTVDATSAGISIAAGAPIYRKKGSSAGMPSNIPRNAEGGVFYRPTLGIFGEAGAEAVVPLDQNKKWIHAVATDFATQMSGMTLAGAAGGDIIIPVYIGQSRIDEVVVSAQQSANYRSGGRA